VGDIGWGVRPWYSLDQFDGLAAGGEGLGRTLPGGRGHVRTPYQQFHFFAEARWGNRAVSMWSVASWTGWHGWHGIMEALKVQKVVRDIAEMADVKNASVCGGTVLLSYRTSWTIYNSGDEVGSNQGGRDVRFVIIYVILINSSGIK
jgi:hypothetical protein